MPFLGDILPLSVQALDGTEGLFVRAELTDPNGNQLPESPVDMQDIGGGKYSDDSVNMPLLAYVECTYTAYEDALYTIPSDDHLLGTDVFHLTVPPPVNVSVNDRMLAVLRQSSLKANIVVPQIRGKLEKTRVRAQLVQPRIFGVFRNQQRITGILRECD